MIQEHLPVPLPCYDFTLVKNPNLGAHVLWNRLVLTTSTLIFFRGVTGGVYKAWERIHRHIADWRLLMIPASCRRVAAYNPN